MSIITSKRLVPQGLQASKQTPKAVSSNDANGFVQNRPSVAPLKQHHLEELAKSAIAKEIAALNFRSLSGHDPLEYLLYGLSDRETRNDGRRRDKWLRKYGHTYAGGYWIRSLDPRTGQEKQFGQFKPDTPRKTKDGKTVKYETPPKVKTEGLFLEPSRAIWDKIGERYETPIPHELNNTQFWQWVIENNLPLFISEGGKKGGALLTAGYPGVALTGIWNACPKTEKAGRVYEIPQLIPDLQLFATPGREIYFVYDSDTNPKTINNVSKAIKRAGELFQQAGCKPKVIHWKSEQGKGVDDLIFNHGVEAFEKALEMALDLNTYRIRTEQKLTFTIDLKLKQRYLGNLDIPKDAEIICLKSPKGTGKTESLVQFIDPLMNQGKRIIVLTHRIQLGQALCNRFGLNYVTELKESYEGSVFGYGLCVDSLHDKSLARFKPEDWEGATVIIDEAEQVLWHLLNAPTEVKKYRPTIIKNLIRLVVNSIAYGGQVVLSDADLSDVCVSFITDICKENLDSNVPGEKYEPKVWIVENEWDSDGYKCYNYLDSQPVRLIADIDEKLRENEKVLLLCSGQKFKSKYGTKNLEKQFKKRYPHLNILRIDSESISDPSHPAYGCIGNLNQIMNKYDLVITSPSIETGVSIDIKGHFNSVFAILQGHQTVDSACQFLARLRENVPRYIWASEKGIGKIGNGSISVGSLMAANNRLYRAMMRAIGEQELEKNIPSFVLRTWAKFAARINQGMGLYRENIIKKLAKEGNEIIDSDPDNPRDPNPTKRTLDLDEYKEGIDRNRDDNYQEYCEQVSQAEPLTHEAYEELAKQKSQTESERIQYRKGTLERLYEGIEITPDVVKFDDKGMHAQLRLHYYLTVGKVFLEKRDRKLIENMKEKGTGDIWSPDFNRKAMIGKVRTLENIGIHVLLKNKEWHKDDPELVALYEKWITPSNQWAIKAILGITIHERMTPIQAMKAILNKIGMQVEYLGRFGSRGDRKMTYGPAISKLVSTPANNDLDNTPGRHGGSIDLSYEIERWEIFKCWKAKEEAIYSEFEDAA